MNSGQFHLLFCGVVELCFLSPSHQMNILRLYEAVLQNSNTLPISHIELPTIHRRLLRLKTGMDILQGLSHQERMQLPFYEEDSKYVRRELMSIQKKIETIKLTG